MNLGNLEIRSQKTIMAFDKIILFGAGNYLIESIKTFGKGKIQAIFDNDEKKWGSIVEGYQILNPHKYIQEYIQEKCAVVLSTSSFQYEIATQLEEEFGVKRELIFSLCPDYQECRMYNVDDIIKNFSKIKKAYSILEDEESKNYLYESLAGRITHDPFRFKGNPRMKGMYCYKGLDVDIQVRQNDHILDCGAYIGDTAREFLRMTQNTGKIFCFEPFEKNYLELQNWRKENGLGDSVNAYCLALSDFEGVMEISSDTEISTRANIRAHSNVRQKVKVTKIDNMLNEFEDGIDFVKMDIEGEELKALLGAQIAIEKYHPKLMISAYHKTSHLWEIPILIHDICPNYRIYLGHNPKVPFEPEVYAVYN